MTMKLLLEALFVGGSLVAYALLITMIMNKIIPEDSVKDYSRMIIGIFVTGFTIHLAFEVSKINAYYCVHGNACQNI